MANDSISRASDIPWKGVLLLVALVAFAIFRSHLGTRLDSCTLAVDLLTRINQPGPPPSKQWKLQRQAE